MSPDDDILKSFILSPGSSILPTLSSTILPKPYLVALNVLFRIESTAVASSQHWVPSVSFFTCHSLYTDASEIKEIYGNGTEHPSASQCS